MRLIDPLLGTDEWQPTDVLMLLNLAIECARPERKARPSLSGYVWHKLKTVRTEMGCSSDGSS